MQDGPHWNQSQLEAFQAVMDEFQQFDNTAGFFVGNEVLTTGMEQPRYDTHSSNTPRQWLCRGPLC
jgi:hypothetical protein